MYHIFATVQVCDTSLSQLLVFPDGRRMVTSPSGNALCLWNFKDGVVLKKMEGHDAQVRTVAVSGDGKLIASSDMGGKPMAWGGETGESLTDAMQAHSEPILLLDFSPDNGVLASVSKSDKTIKLWRTG